MSCRPQNCLRKDFIGEFEPQLELTVEHAPSLESKSIVSIAWRKRAMQKCNKHFRRSRDQCSAMFLVHDVQNSCKMMCNCQRKSFWILTWWTLRSMDHHGTLMVVNTPWWSTMVDPSPSRGHLVPSPRHSGWGFNICPRWLTWSSVRSEGDKRPLSEVAGRGWGHFFTTECTKKTGWIWMKFLLI